MENIRTENYQILYTAIMTYELISDEATRWVWEDVGGPGIGRMAERSQFGHAGSGAVLRASGTAHLLQDTLSGSGAGK